LGSGHETTVTSLGWILFELATHPSEQHRLREEIRSVQAADCIDGAGAVDFDALPFLNAVIKVGSTLLCQPVFRLAIQETIRFDTVVPHLFREATRNEVIPLSEEVRCRSGTITGELYIPQGTHIIISNAAYNRWGYLTAHHPTSGPYTFLQEQKYLG
jgi:cytochrome P450